MNRRDFVSVIPSLSLFSIIPLERYLRAWYMDIVFREYEITTSNGRGETYFDAFQFDAKSGVMKKYEYDTNQRIHRFCIRINNDESLHTLIEGEVNSMREAKEELEEEIVLP